MTWRDLPHSGHPLLTSDRGVLTLDPAARTVRRLVDDQWVIDVALPDDGDEDTEWLVCAVAGSRLVALRDDASVADLDGDAAPRLFDARRSADTSDLFALDPSMTPPRPTLITTEYDRGTWVLEGERWRRVKSKVPSGDLVACTTPVGLFVLHERELWRVSATGWTAVAMFEDEPTDEGSESEIVPTCLTCDGARRLLLGATDTVIVALGPDGWQRVVETPGTITHLAIDAVGDRLVAATESATFALPLAPLGLSGWLPGAPRAVALDPNVPLKLELTKEVVDPPDRAALGIKRGETVLALLPPNLAVFESSSRAGLRVAIVAAGVVPPMPVLYHPWGKRLVVCRVVADASEQPSGHTRAGGAPQWIQNESVPTCKRCKNPMRFRVQLCEDLYDCYFGDAGRAYVFDCAACGTADFVGQC